MDDQKDILRQLTECAAEIAKWNADIAARWLKAAKIAVNHLAKETSLKSTFIKSISAEDTAARIDEFATGRNPDAAIYGSRISHPNNNALRDALSALLESPDGTGPKVALARATSTGMAGVAAVLEGVLKPGDHIVVSEHLFSTAKQYIDIVTDRLGVNVTWVDGRNPQDWKKAVDKAPPKNKLLFWTHAKTKMFFLETPFNPDLGVIDIKKVSEIARAAGALVAVDGTMVSSLAEKFFQQGVHLYMESETKRLVGERGNAGFIAVSDEGLALLEKLEPKYNNAATKTALFHTLLSKRDALTPEQARYGLEQILTLGPRFMHQTNVTHDLAQHLSDNGIRVLYPGLKNVPLEKMKERERQQYDIAQEQMLKRADGAVIGGSVFTIDCGTRDMAFRVQNILLEYGASLETNFGQKEFHATHQASNTYRGYTPEQRAKAGITDGMVRFSPGENANLEYWKFALDDAFGITPAVTRERRASYIKSHSPEAPAVA